MTLSPSARVLFAVAVVAVAAFAWFELPSRRAAEQADADAARLFPRFGAAVDRIVIEQPGQRIELESDANQWNVVAPVHDAAEYSRVATLLAEMSRTRVERNLGVVEDTTPFGFTPASSVVTLFAATDTVAHIELGSHTVDRAFVYARRDDGSILLLPTALARAAALPVDAYRDQNIARFELVEVEAVVVRKKGVAAVEWRRRGENAWFTIVAGDTVAGDSVDVASYIRRFRGMRVGSFIDADTTGAFASPAGVVSLQRYPPAPTITLRFVARGDGTFWNRNDGNTRVVAVAGDVPAALDASVATLRDRRLLHFDPSRATRMTIVTPDTSAILIRAGGNWALPNPALGRVDRDSARDFVRALRALRFREALAIPPGAVDPPAFTLRIVDDHDVVLDELRARPSSRTDGDWLVTSQSSKITTSLAASEIDAIVVRLRRLRSARGRRRRA